MPAQFQRKIHRARRILDAVGHAYPGAWSAFDSMRSQRGSAPDFDWPDWCYMPIAGGYAVVSGGGDRHVSLSHASHPAIVTALATWRMTQGVYRFDATLLDDLLATPMEGDIPAEHLQRLPEWCVYVDLKAAGIHPSLHGAWLHMEYDIARGGQPEFRIVFDTARDPRQPFAVDGLEPLPLPLAGTIDESLAKVARNARNVMGDVLPASAESDLQAQRDLVRPMLSLALYLCADADITRRNKVAFPSNPAPRHMGAGNWMLHPASGPTQWDVGTRIGAALRAAYQREQLGGSAAPTGKAVRPHVRRAHWHTFVSGPRKRPDGSPIAAPDRRRELRWMPPIPVNVDEIDALPVTVKPVRPV